MHSGPFTPEDRSRWMDPHVKRPKYEAAGVPAYWIADPQAQRGTVLELEDGRYVERGTVERGTGGPGGELALTRPYDLVLSL